MNAIAAQGAHAGHGGAASVGGGSWGAAANQARAGSWGGQAAYGQQQAAGRQQAGWSGGAYGRSVANAADYLSMPSGWSAQAPQQGQFRIANALDILNLPAGWSAGPQPQQTVEGAGLGLANLIRQVAPPGSELGFKLTKGKIQGSEKVGHDSAVRAAQAGDYAGWLVNTNDHAGHSHPLGGAAGTRLSSQAHQGTVGQEKAYASGNYKQYGDARAYDQLFGTNYVQNGGDPNHIGVKAAEAMVPGIRAQIKAQGAQGMDVTQHQPQAQTQGGGHAGH